MEAIIDVEDHVKNGKPVPRGRRYQIRIDGQKYETAEETLTGREILQLAGKDPAKHQLNQRLHGGRVEAVGLEERVDLTTAGVERFFTIPLDCTEGSPLRRDFPLPVEEQDSLARVHEDFETIVEKRNHWLILRNYQVPEGYNHKAVDLALLIPGSYPHVQLDMVYFYPPLAHGKGKAINALTSQSIEGKSYQRWSRHRSAVNPWRPGTDNIQTHLVLVEQWLKRELQ